MRPCRLHVLIVDPAVGVDVVAEVRRIGPFTQMSLDAANIAVTDPTVAVHQSDQEAYACLSRG